MMKFDTVIHNGTVVTVNRNFDILPDGVVGVRDGVIKCVQARCGDPSGFPAAEYIDAGGGIIMPGLVNAHTHLPMSLFRGLADDLPLEEWLYNHVFPAESRHLTPQTVRVGALLSCLEMVMSGTTCCCDGYFLEDATADAVAQAGIRAVLGQGVIDYPAPGVRDPSRNVAIADAFVENQKGRSPLLTPSIFCHSPYACSAETLQKAKAAASRHGVLFQVHVAETLEESNNSLKAHGLSPVARLDKLGVLDENTLAVHGVWVDEKDMEILADRRVKVAHTPESNLKLACGVAPIPRLMEKGVTVGLGTDGCASNNNLDMFGEMDMAAKLHKVTALDPTVMNARTVIQMATLEGARAIGLGNTTGSLEPGKQADVIIIDTHQPHLTPLYHPESHLVYAVRGGDVRDVLVAGTSLVRNRRPVLLDMADIFNQAKAIFRRIQAF